MTTIPPMPDAIVAALESRGSIKKQRQPFITWSANTAKAPGPIDWIVEDLIVAGDITIMAGDGGIGKSWKAAHIAMQVANGDQVDATFKTKQGNVLWYDNENGPEETKRRCFLLDRSKQSRETRFMDFDVLFSCDTWIANEEGLNNLYDDIEKCNPSLIIFDSFVSILPEGCDENKATEVRKVLDDLMHTLRFNRDGTERTTPVGCLILHHTKKSTDARAKEKDWPAFRGSSDIKNGCSFLIIMRENSFEDKDGKDMHRIQFKLEKARRGRKNGNVYEYELVDHGDDTDPFRWVEYVCHGKATGKKEAQREIILANLRNGLKYGLASELSVKELQELWDDGVMDNSNLRKMVKEMVTEGLLIGEKRGKEFKYRLA